MKNSERNLMNSIYRHCGANVERTPFYGGCIFRGDAGRVTCYYPVNEVFTSAAADGLIKTKYSK